MSSNIPFLFFLKINLILLSLEIDSSKVLILYFSNSGNIQKISDYINKATNIEFFKIEPKISYPSNYEELIKIVKNEQNTNARPEIDNPLTDISNYDIILLGYPLWYGHLPNIVITQLELLNLNNKEIYPFITHDGNGAGKSFDDIKNYVCDCIIHDNFNILEIIIKNNGKIAKEKINLWLDDIGIDIINDVYFDKSESFFNIWFWSYFFLLFIFI